MKHVLTAFLSVLMVAAAANAQTTDVFLRGVPSGTATATPLTLSLGDAIARGLEQNLGALLQAERVAHAEGSRWGALSALLPHASANVRESRQLVNAAAYGFTSFPGVPALIGPYSVFDARLAVSAPLLDLEGLKHLRANRAAVEAEKHDLQHARELVVLVVANLYLTAIADASRAEAARTQAQTAQALYTLAADQKNAGIVAGIDVIRQQVQREAARQRVIAAEASEQQDRLKLSRAIGLPPGQAIILSDAVPYKEAPAITLEQAIAEATTSREDLKSAESRALAARAARDAAQASGLPSIHVDGDYGALGSTAGDTRGTYAVAANVHLPLFEGGAVKARIAQAEADLRQREAELADLRAGVQYDVQSSLLDVSATTAAVDVARSRESLARQQLQQAEDRFRAGVANTIELAEAQDALALASERYIESLYAHNIAKASLARSLGVVGVRFSEFVGGR